jgi:hypothetical protein
MQLKGLKEEDFVNYSKPSMFLIFPHCSFKCDKENDCNLCQNSHLAQEKTLDIRLKDILDRYADNLISKAIVCGGLEPFDSAEELFYLIHTARDLYGIEDDIVIYTGYTEEELQSNLYFKYITKYSNVIIKFGRFRPNEESHYDEILGIKLVSNNQYAKRYN